MRFITSTALVIAAVAVMGSAGWELKDEPIATRRTLCESNKAICATHCGGANKAPMNFCNVTTMGWNCGCSDKTPTLEDHEWPIVYAECQGRRLDCQKKCSDVPVDKYPACQNECTETYDCDRGKMPPSNLRVSSVEVVPGTESSKKSDSDDGDKSASSNMASSFSWTYTAGALTMVAGAMWTL
jgi:hypothetical protein